MRYAILTVLWLIVLAFFAAFVIAVNFYLDHWLLSAACVGAVSFVVFVPPVIIGKFID